MTPSQQYEQALQGVLACLAPTGCAECRARMRAAQRRIMMSALAYIVVTLAVIVTAWVFIVVAWGAFSPAATVVDVQLPTR